MTEHILTVPVDGNPAGFAIACPGVTDACNGWAECINDDCDIEALEAAVDNGDDPIAHGVEHREMDGWCVSTGGCWMVDHPDTFEAARYLDLPPGAHPVHAVHESGDDWGTLRLAVAAEVSA